MEDRNAPSVMATDGMLMIEAKPEGLLGLNEDLPLGSQQVR